MRKKSRESRANGAKKAALPEGPEPGDDAAVDQAAQARSDRSSMSGRPVKQQFAGTACSSDTGPGAYVTRKPRRRATASISGSLSSRLSDVPKVVAVVEGPTNHVGAPPTDDAAAGSLRYSTDTKRSGTRSAVPSTSSEAPPSGASSFDAAVTAAATVGGLPPEDPPEMSAPPIGGAPSSYPPKTQRQEDVASKLTKSQAHSVDGQPPSSVQSWTSSASGSRMAPATAAVITEGLVQEATMPIATERAPSTILAYNPSVPLVPLPMEQAVTTVTFSGAVPRPPPWPLTSVAGTHDLLRSDTNVTTAYTQVEQKRRIEDLVQLFSWEKVTSVVERLGSLAILASVLLFVVVVTFVLALLVGSRMRGGEKPGVCASEDCIQHVRALGIDVGRSPSPCESFGRFVCSGWKTGDREFANTVPRQVALEWILRVEQMSLRDFDRDAVVNRPLIMMRKCMRHTADEKDAVASLIAMVESSSFAWPTQDEESETPVIDYSRALRLLLELSVLWALPLWFRVRMLPATAHFQRDRAIVLSPSGLASTWQVFHETLLCYDDAYPIYLSYFNASIFKYRPPSQSFMIFLKTRSASVQTQVLSNLSSVPQSLHRTSRLLEIRSLPATVKKLAAEDWVQAFRSLYSPSHNVTANDLLLATNGGLLNAVGSIFALNTAQDILFHTIWWFVQSVGIAASSELISAVNKHSDSMYFRQIVCFDHAYTTYNVLLASVHKSLFSAQERLSIARHLESVRTVAVEKLRSYSKISDASKRALSNVLEDMSTVIWPEEDFGRPGGFAEYYGQPYRGEDGFLGEWLWSHLQLQNSEAAAAGSHDYVAASKIYHTGSDRMMYYNPILNTMSVSLSAMRPPFYYREATSAVIYGGLGFLYAQAILDALADIAHLLHGDVVTQPSDAMTTTWSFWNASWCQHIDNRLAYPEIPALDVAYTAYIRFRDEASDLPLKGLPCCTPKQVFFATMCHCSCYVGSSKTKQSRVCEVAVKNFEAFSETFSCPLGSSMNTYPKCVYA